MKTRAGRSFVVAVAMAMFAGTLAWIAVPSLSADPCPVGVSGHWSGSGLTGSGFPFTLEAEITFVDNSMSGTVSVNGGTPTAFTGTVVCTVIEFGTVAPATTFSGTLAPDGLSASGSYTLGSDTGTWTNAYNPGEALELTATSAAQPSTVAPGAATSWHVDVQNTGSDVATGVLAYFDVSGSGAFGPMSETSVSQGTGCTTDVEVPTRRVCDLGTLLPGQKESAQATVISTGGAGTQIFLDAAATAAGGGDDIPPTVTISVVAPDALPPGEASGIAQPGATFATPGKVSEENPIVVKFKLPRKVAAGSTGAVALSPNRSKKQRFIDGASLVSYRTGGAKHQVRTKARTVGRPRATMVSGPAVPMSISRIASEASTFCDGVACSGDVIHLTSFSGYNDRRKPAKVTITWDASVRGRGTASSIFKRGDSATSPLRTLPTCLKVPKLGYSNLPCVSKRKQLGSGAVQFIILMLSGDPKFGRR